MAKSLGPFIDCTSNQIIAYFEALKHPEIVNEAAKKALELETDEAKRVAVGVQILVGALIERLIDDADETT